VRVLARVNMGLPRRGRALSRQRDGEYGGTVGLHGDHKGRLEGKHLIAEGEHHGGRWHRDRGGQRLAIRLTACAERADRVGLVSEMLEKRRETGKGACAFPTSEPGKVVQRRGQMLPLGLGIAQENVEVDGGSHKELREKGPGNARGLGDLCHCAVGALIEPSQHNQVDTSVRSSIRASDTLHGVASGGRDGDRSNGSHGESPSYAHQRWHGHGQPEFERCRGMYRCIRENSP